MRVSIAPRTQAALVVAITLVVIVGCRNEPKIYYSADPITARVVDAETKQPLAGVNVLAEWTAYGGGLEGGNLTGHAMVMEAVTDETGTFSLPGWGPKLRHFGGLITTDAPLLVLFKSGYRAQGWSNFAQRGRAPSHMQSEWNGKALELRRFEGSMAEYAHDLSLYFDTQMRSLVMTGECNLKKTPQFLLAIDRQRQEFVRYGTKLNLDDMSILSERDSRECRSLDENVRGRKK